MTRTVTGISQHEQGTEYYGYDGNTKVETDTLGLGSKIAISQLQGSTITQSKSYTKAQDTVTNCVILVAETGIERAFSKCRAHVREAIQFCQRPNAKALTRRCAKRCLLVLALQLVNVTCKMSSNSRNQLSFVRLSCPRKRAELTVKQDNSLVKYRAIPP